MADNILIVDDEPGIRELLRSQLSYLGHRVATAGDGPEALAHVAAMPGLELVLLDIDLPGTSGLELLARLKAVDENLQVVMEIVRRALRAGAYDYLVKPFELEDLSSTVGRALERHRLIRQNLAYQQNLERMVLEQTEAIRQTRDIALLTLARLAESRDNETGHHLERIAAYSRHLAEALAEGPYRRLATPQFISSLERSAPLHDIGKVGVPDAVLLKGGPLTADEWTLMRAHTTIGGDTLRGVIEQYTGHSFLVMAMEIAYSHHERWDGGGYPHGRAGEEIPLGARIVTLADAYDAITSARPYKVAYDHQEAVARITVDRGQHFDPVIVDTFLACADDIDRISRTLRDPDLMRAMAGSGAWRDPALGSDPNATH